MTQPTVSRRIAELEESVGRPLFRRDSDGAHLTTEGARLFEAAEQMVRWSRELERAASSFDATAEGPVRIAAAPGVAFELLVPFAARIRARHPKIRIEVLTGIDHIDLSRGEADFALRTRATHQPELLTVATLRLELGVFCAQKLADTLGAGPYRGAELPWVSWSYPMEHVTPRPQLEAALANFELAFGANDYLVQRHAVEAGLGAFILPRATRRLGGSEPLVELQTDLPLPPNEELNLVCAKTALRLPRVRCILEELLEVLASAPTIALDVHDEGFAFAEPIAKHTSSLE